MSGAAPSRTLPGSIRGLLRRGSPVLVPLPRVRKPCLRGLVDGVDIDSDGVWVLTRDGAPTMWAPSDIALDLEVDTGRAHAAWWALGRCPRSSWPALHAGARLWLDPSMYDSDPGAAVHARADLWRVLRSAGRVYDWLHHLDDRDPRLLPDGSRRIDAEALRLVCLHVAGLPVGGSV